MLTQVNDKVKKGRLRAQGPVTDVHSPALLCSKVDFGCGLCRTASSRLAAFMRNSHAGSPHFIQAESTVCSVLSASTMSQHDLTHELCKSLDRHLAFPLLEFLSHRQLYDDADIQRAKIDLLQKTNMVDYAAEIYQALYNTEEIPDDMNTRRKAVVGKLKTLQVLSLTLTIQERKICVPHTQQSYTIDP